MKYNDYQNFAKETCANLGGNMDLCHMILGLTSEINEFNRGVFNGDKQNIGEEIGDICWYFANYCSKRNISFEDVFVKATFNDDSYIDHISKLADLIKKNIAYQKTIDSDVEWNILKNMAFSIFKLCSQLDLELPKVLDNNIKKLKTRYPDKFTTYHALNRDLEKEASVLDFSEDLTEENESES